VRFCFSSNYLYFHLRVELQLFIFLKFCYAVGFSYRCGRNALSLAARLLTASQSSFVKEIRTLFPRKGNSLAPHGRYLCVSRHQFLRRMSMRCFLFSRTLWPASSEVRAAHLRIALDFPALGKVKCVLTRWLNNTNAAFALCYFNN
jgi:hypothetical protein